MYTFPLPSRKLVYYHPLEKAVRVGCPNDLFRDISERRGVIQVKTSSNYSDYGLVL